MSGQRGRAGRGGGRNSSARNSGGPKYSRSARVGATLQEIIADELVRIDDERLAFVSITDIDVDPELNRAIVFFDSLAGEDGDAEILVALGEHRIRLQASIARQIRAKKTPILDFRADLVIRSAERIDDILRADRERAERLGADRPGADDTDGTDGSDGSDGSDG
jgi:ribosome-binding factor A